MRKVSPVLAALVLAGTLAVPVAAADSASAAAQPCLPSIPAPPTPAGAVVGMIENSIAKPMGCE